jgi:hypothetical protein
VMRGDPLVPSLVSDHCIMKRKSRNVSLLWMAEDMSVDWAFLTNHAQVLIASRAIPASACVTLASVWGLLSGKALVPQRTSSRLPLGDSSSATVGSTRGRAA